jgi:hypothetical protein
VLIDRVPAAPIALDHHFLVSTLPLPVRANYDSRFALEVAADREGRGEHAPLSYLCGRKSGVSPRSIALAHRASRSAPCSQNDEHRSR